jgi:hypothetical protein
MQLNTAQALAAAEAAYGVDAEHVARELLTGLLLRDAVPLAVVHRTIERGLSRYHARRLRLKEGLPESAGREAPA